MTTINVGITNNLKRSLYEHNDAFVADVTHFTWRYKCVYLVYWECFTNVDDAINREKQLKRWSREKKIKLVSAFNPKWDFLNDSIE